MVMISPPPNGFSGPTTYEHSHLSERRIPVQPRKHVRENVFSTALELLGKAFFPSLPFVGVDGRLHVYEVARLRVVSDKIELALPSTMTEFADLYVPLHQVAAPIKMLEQEILKM